MSSSNAHGLQNQATPETQTIDDLPFETGDLLDFLQERPLYFTAQQVQSWIEHFAPLMKEWMEGLPQTQLYYCLYDICDCNYKTMWDTIDTMMGLVAKYARVDAPSPSDAFEYTALYAGRMVRESVAPGFLFDIPEEDLTEPDDRVHTCKYATICLFIVAMVDLRKERFFSQLLGGTLPEPKELMMLRIDNEPGRVDWKGSSVDSGKQLFVRPKAAAELAKEVGGKSQRGGSKGGSKEQRRVRWVRI